MPPRLTHLTCRREFAALAGGALEPFMDNWLAVMNGVVNTGGEASMLAQLNEWSAPETFEEHLLRAWGEYVNGAWEEFPVDWDDLPETHFAEWRPDEAPL